MNLSASNNKKSVKISLLINIKIPEYHIRFEVFYWYGYSPLGHILRLIQHIEWIELPMISNKVTFLTVLITKLNLPYIKPNKINHSLGYPRITLYSKLQKAQTVSHSQQELHLKITKIKLAWKKNRALRLQFENFKFAYINLSKLSDFYILWIEKIHFANAYMYYRDVSRSNL